MIARGFMLGLASGGACLAACAPALVVALLGRGRTVAQTVRFVVLLLGGRLAGYLLFAVAAWSLGRSLTAPLGREVITGALFVLLALLMAAQGLKLVPERELCAAGFVLARLPRQELVTIGAARPALAGVGPSGGAAAGRGARALAIARGDGGLPVLLGLATGVSVCPPFVLAVADASSAASLGESVAFFAAFFVATSLYFTPALALGALGRRDVIAHVARLAALIAAAYYLYRGALLLVAALAVEPP